MLVRHFTTLLLVLTQCQTLQLDKKTLAHGYGALYSNKTGDLNSAVGVDALYNNTGSYNNAFGYRALYLAIQQVKITLLLVKLTSTTTQLEVEIQHFQMAHSITAQLDEIILP